MIKTILTSFAARLDEYLRRKFPQPEGVAETGFIGNGTEEKPCKLIISLVNIEREVAGGISAGLSRNASEYAELPAVVAESGFDARCCI